MTKLSLIGRLGEGVCGNVGITNDWLIGWFDLIWLIDWLVHSSIDWLIYLIWFDWFDLIWLIKWLIDWFDWLIWFYFIDWLIDLIWFDWWIDWFDLNLFYLIWLICWLYRIGWHDYIPLCLNRKFNTDKTKQAWEGGWGWGFAEMWELHKCGNCTRVIDWLIG